MLRKCWGELNNNRCRGRITNWQYSRDRRGEPFKIVPDWHILFLATTGLQVSTYHWALGWTGSFVLAVICLFVKGSRPNVPLNI
jgi:hypothetical protein